MTYKLQQAGLGWLATPNDVKGVGAYGPTKEEALWNLRKNLVIHFEFNPAAIPLQEAV